MMEERPESRRIRLAALTSRWFVYSILCIFCFAGFAIASRLGGQKGMTPSGA